MKHKMLIVDDEPDIREIIRYNLEQENYIAIEAENGDEALDQLKNNPDLIILDIMMPGKDGYEVCRKIRSAGNNVSIMFLTAMDREFDEVKALEMGGDDYIVKPFRPKKLLARVNAITRRAKENSEKLKGIIYKTSENHLGNVGSI